MNRNCYQITSTGSLFLKNEVLLNSNYSPNFFFTNKDYQTSEKWLNNTNLKSHNENLKELNNYRFKMLYSKKK